MSEWPIKTIAECASPEPYSTQIGPFGKALMAKEYTVSGVPVLRGVNVNAGRFYDDGFVFISEGKADELAKYESYPGDVLLVHKGTLGEIGLMPESRKHSRYIMGNSMMRVRCDRAKLLPEYLYYWLSSSDGQHYLFSRVSQVGVPQLQRPLTTLREAAFPVPPLPEQERIAHILGTLDDKIELNRRMNQTLEAIARAIFKSWFVDFDPVHAKAEGREPVGMDPETAALFPDSFQDSPLGKIPKGWDVKPFSEVVEVNPSRSLKKGEVAPYIDMASLPTVGAQLEGLPGSRAYKSGSRFRNGDVLFARITPCLENGKTVLVDFLSERAIGAGSTEFLVFGPGLAGTYFAYCASRWTALREHAIASMTGTSGRQRAQKGAFDHFKMAVPEQKILEAFETHVAPLFAAQRSASQESRCLPGIRDTLLPHLLSGGLASQEELRGCIDA